MCKWQLADGNVVIGWYRLLAKRLIIERYQLSADYQCISSNKIAHGPPVAVFYQQRTPWCIGRPITEHAGWSTPEPSIRRVWPTVVPAQCRMTSLVCRNGRHLFPKFTAVDRLFLWQFLTPIYISQPDLLSTWTLTTLTIFRSCSSVSTHDELQYRSTVPQKCKFDLYLVWSTTFRYKDGVRACRVVTSQHSAGWPR